MLLTLRRFEIPFNVEGAEDTQVEVVQVQDVHLDNVEVEVVHVDEEVETPRADRPKRTKRPAIGPNIPRKKTRSMGPPSPPPSSTV